VSFHRKQILVASDFHLPHADESAVQALLNRVDFLRDPDFDYVLLNGDVLDGEDPGLELEALEIFGKRLRRFTDVPVVVVIGNHDAAAASKMRGGLVELTRHFVRCLGPGTAVSRSFSQPPFLFRHGTLHKGHYAEASAKGLRAGTSLVVGHTHRGQMHTDGPTAVFGLPCMSLRGVQGAQLGFGIARVDGTRRSFEYVFV
jgi:predicted phosphodiesterase